MGYNIKNWGILIQEERRGYYCSKLKKGKLKTKNLSKIAILDEKEPSNNQQTEPKHCMAEVEELYSLKPGNLPSQHLYLKRSTVCHARANPSEETLSESSQIRELYEAIKILSEEVTFSNASAKA